MNTSNDTRIVGLILPKGTIEALDSFLTETMKYLSLPLEQRGFNLAFFNEENYDLQKYLELFKTRTLEGIILFSPSLNDTDRIERLATSPIPSAVIYSHYDSIDSFTCDNEYGAYSAVKYLIEKGRRKIAYIHGSPQWMDSNDRFAGYKKALAEHGIEFHPDLVKNAYYDYSKARIVTDEFLSQWNKPDAIFAANDKMAQGTIAALHAKGLSVPDDISVIGYDDIKENEYADIPLTTIAQPLKEICAALIERIVPVMEQREKPKNTVFVSLKPELIIRKSA